MSAENQQSAAVAKYLITRTRNIIFNSKIKICHILQQEQLPNQWQLQTSTATTKTPSLTLLLN
eukprot:4453256-Ditylum_brightwellii.AAC.2